MNAQTRQVREAARNEIQRLEEHPQYRALVERHNEILGRIDQANLRRKIAAARNRGEQPSKPMADRADALLKGGQVMLLPPDAEIAAADEEVRILDHARFKLWEEMEAVKSELSFEVCKRFAPRNAEALRAVDQAATALHEALEACRVIRGRIIGAGYSLNDTALPMNTFPAAASLGDPQLRSLTAAGRFREWLTQRDIL